MRGNGCGYSAHNHQLGAVQITSFQYIGTASTMACLVEALGLMPLGSACAPAVSASRLRMAEQTGQIAVSLTTVSSAHLKPQSLLQKRNFENAIVALQALGGSTNAIIHLLAMAGRLPGIELTLDDFDRIGKKTPLLVNLKPSGSEYMEDLHRAGGVPTLLRMLSPLLDLGAMTITGKTLGEALDVYPDSFSQTVVRPLTDPLFPNAALAVLRGNLAPLGCVIKQSAATPSLLRHRGQAIVFKSTADMAERIDSDTLEVSSESILVLQHIGPVGHANGSPGMPEAGLIPIPKKLAKMGVKDMVRISDGRMSGTAEGTIVLHCAPEAGVGGPIGLVKDGDWIFLDVSERRITLEVEETVIDQRKKEWEENSNRIGNRQV